MALHAFSGGFWEGDDFLGEGADSRVENYFPFRRYNMFAFALNGLTWNDLYDTICMILNFVIQIVDRLCKANQYFIEN